MRGKLWPGVLALAALGWPASVAAVDTGPLLKVDVRRVRISLGFAGQQIFIYGQAPPGTRRVVSVVEAPPAGPVRLARKGRVGPFWLGVDQYAVANVPGLYLVNASCPGGNVTRPCPEEDPLAHVARILERVHISVGPAEIARRARIQVLSGEDTRAKRAALLRGFWTLEQSRGLYGVNGNGIFLGPDGKYFYRANVPASAPEATYAVTTYFLGDDSMIDAARVELYVCRQGLVAWLARLAERRAYLYGAITVFIALAAGLFVGTVFRRGGHQTKPSGRRIAGAAQHAKGV